MREIRNEQFPSRYRNVDEKAARRRALRSRTRSATAELLTSSSARLKPETQSDERYLTFPISPLLGKGLRWSIGIHQGFAICLAASAVFWTGIIAVIRAL
jgi:hypothetical protein